MRRAPFRPLVCMLCAAGLAHANVADFSCAVQHKLKPVSRGDDALEVQYARSIFRYKGGSAYFVGGSPGYLMTAHHVVVDSGDQVEQVCSPFVTSQAGVETCLQVEVASSFEKEDLALLKLESPLPYRVEPISLATKRNGHGRRVTVIAYPQMPESGQRSYYVGRGRITSEAVVESGAGSVPLRDVTIYYVDVPQYRGASGAPMIDSLGHAWATGVRATDGYQTAYGIPHHSKEVVTWILKNTAASQAAQAWLEDFRTSSDVDSVNHRLACALDVRRNEAMSSLDLMHIGVVLGRVRGDQASRLILNVLAEAAPTTDWNVVLDVARGVRGSVAEVVEIEERQKEVAFQMAERLAESQERAAWLLTSADHALEALARSWEGGWGGWIHRESALDVAQSLLGPGVDDHRETGEMTDHAALRRATVNLEDATKLLAGAYRITGDFGDLHRAMWATSLDITARATLDPEASEWQAREAFEGVMAPAELQPWFEAFRSSLPVEGGIYTSGRVDDLLASSKEPETSPLL